MYRITAAWEDRRIGFKDPAYATAASSAASVAPSITSISSSSSTSNARPIKKQRSMTDHIIAAAPLSKDMVETLNFLLITLLSGCALPFLLVKSKYFKQFIKMLNPAYAAVMPGPDAMSRTWLPKLYSETESKINAVWDEAFLTCPYRTIGADAVKTEGGDVINITEACDDIVAFVKCAQPGNVSQDGKYYAKLIIETMEESVKRAKKPPQQLYSTACMDNTSCNYAAFRHINAVFPWLICIGCRVHFHDLLCEDIFNIKEFYEILTAVR